ncbi:FHA domain-containing protein [Ornithinimicrobium avium]|uniref:FHA domain-containing protein n=1 Tax=Ornithinimicrobium avium TaxID=2283195 RepID=UPI00192D47CB|nr:FHA domain-containing protein [Ornithinimicrobium avium]
MSAVECTRCGFVNSTGTTLCQGCQGSLSAGPRFVDIGVSDAAPVPTPHRAEEEGWRCPACGAELGPDDPFCPQDGEPRSGAVRTGAGPAVTAAATGLRLTLPGGSTLDVSDGVPLDLGRDVSDRRVNAALEDRTGVSRRHARVQLHGGSVTVLDLGSTNGTRVNGELVEAPVTIPLDQLERLDLGMNATIWVSPWR